MVNQIIVISSFCMIVVLVALVLLVVLSSMSRKTVKIAFGLLCLSMSVWILANTFADTHMDMALFWSRLSFASAAVMAAALLVFVLYFPRRARHAYAWSLVVLGMGSIVALMSSTFLVVESVTIQNGYANVNPGGSYIIYFAYIVLAVASALSLLFYRLRVETGANSERVKYILLGTAITALVGGSTNLILPAITGSNPLAIYGSFSAFAFISMVAYAIVRHKLFSIRLATARAAAYLLSGISLGLFFGIIIFGMSGTFFEEQDIPVSQRLFYAVSAVLVGFMFPAIKRFFDRLTSSVLLRDLYNPEAVLKNVTSIITKSKTSRSLLKSVAHEIKTQLRLNIVEYGAYSQDDTRVVSYTNQGQQRSTNAIEKLIASRSGVLVTLTQDDYETIGRDDIGVILTLKTKQGLHGYLAVGHKQNGTAFTENDKSLLESVANEVAIATENYIRFEAIEKFNETLQRNVNDATRELRDSNKKLRELDETKDEFISMASHQLRTPLTSVKGYISMLLDGDMGELQPAQRQVLEEAYSSSQRMVYLIGDFLNLSRLKTGKFVIERAPVSLPQIIEQEINQLREAAKIKNITLVYDTPDNFPVLMLDETKIRQVMMNFIDNAIYYSKPEGGNVEISLIKHTHHITFKVVDDGIGVPAEERKKLFTKFYRAENARRARPDGTGVGLFMAKKVIVALGGAILFESKEDHGSTFGFRLPLDESTKVLGKQSDNTDDDKR